MANTQFVQPLGSNDPMLMVDTTSTKIVLGKACEMPGHAEPAGHAILARTNDIPSSDPNMHVWCMGVCAAGAAQPAPSASPPD